ncbi:hypothetical protein [Bradyrhizobium sp. SZCCHNRI2010]|uniref:hypothetical protein n=1 Tax=Bradyrhizobium sp. SZCCHNRI2010 TaxID=3057283 RepID=UPI0028EF0BBC|nr:hypothetical protein [Bradyrhizobium sp. SZCCHNRI2010]
MKNVKPAAPRQTKTYNKPSMKGAPNVNQQRLPREWDGAGEHGHAVSYATRVAQVHLQEKHEAQRRKNGGV